MSTREQKKRLYNTGKSFLCSSEDENEGNTGIKTPTYKEVHGIGRFLQQRRG